MKIHKMIGFNFNLSFDHPYLKFKLASELFSMKKSFYILIVGILFLHFVQGKTEEEKRSFFESKIRPTLAENCYECHNSVNQQKGGLILDHKSGLLEGGQSGPSIIPGDPERSLLIRVITHVIPNLKMPRGGPKLTDQAIEDFKEWIADGAYDPRKNPPSAKEFADETAWEKILAKRKSWWSFQPIRQYSPPTLNTTNASHPVDSFLVEKMINSGLQPNEDAEGSTVLRRITFALTGLPPTIRQQESFADLAENGLGVAVEIFTKDLLDSPHFGERWARHWMDWIRYADSHGSEGDPLIPNAYRYRNYLIRALNDDIGFDQLVLEHLAGDLLENPRFNRTLRLNESAIGTSHLRFVLHGFAPTDALDEHVRFTDDQIDAVTKAFLGLTVSCARCHNHKFDAISQEDYYALFGIFSNGRPAQKVIDDPKYLNGHDEKLHKIKSKIKTKILHAWQKTEPDFENLKSLNENDFLYPLMKLRGLDDEEFSKEWKSLNKLFIESKLRLDTRRKTKYPLSWDLGNAKNYASWKRDGTGLKEGPTRAGSFTLNTNGENIIENILPAGAFTNILSTKQNGTLSSNRFVFKKGDLWVRAIGDEGTTLRYSVWNYPRKGTIYKKLSLDPSAEKWFRFNTDYWEGETGYIEINTSRNHPVEADDSQRSWFGITEALHASPGQANPRDEMAEILSPIFASPLTKKTYYSLETRYRNTIKEIVAAWKLGSLTNSQARILNSLIKNKALPNTISEISNCSILVQKYRELEALIKTPRLAPGVLDGAPFDQSLFVRGNHKNPAHEVPRRFLEAIDKTPYPKESIGRFEFGMDLIREDNPFTARVIVNRIWHHVFGNGLVRTPDNFGRLGELPSHPELLDYLASKFREEKWSIKNMIKFLMTSKAFRSSSTPTRKAKELDPKNLLISHANLKRLEAESVRDSMLFVSGRLKLDKVAEVKSQPPNNLRRAVYRQIKRNSLDPFLSVFDAPVPSSAKGKRDITNVPAQSLTLMNDPDVLSGAKEFAHLHKIGTLEERISKMFRIALGRFPSSTEISQIIEYFHATDQEALALKTNLADKREQLIYLKTQINEIIEPMRKEILSNKKNNPSFETKSRIAPSLHWDFKNGLIDTVAGVRCILKDGATLQNGELNVRKGGYAVTEKIPFNISEKTISVQVKLDSIDQKGGGVMTVQSRNGAIFDSIVFAEKHPGQWMSGSNGFTRTQTFYSAPPEKEAAKNFIHFAITYSADGTVTGYRNGKVYGRPYQTKTSSFKKDESVISFGLRHLPSNPNRLLNGSIRKASLIKRALTQVELKSFFNPVLYVSNDEIIDKLGRGLRAKLIDSMNEKEHLENEISGLQKMQVSEVTKLQDLALALFNMKEFIYIR